MSVNVSEIGRVIGCLFPLEYACDWDNSGFQVDMGNETDKILICLDVTPEIIREAAGMGCGMIVSHHPLLFRPLKSVKTDGYAGGCTAELIKNGISLYSAHTSVDNAADGLNHCLADMLGLKNREFLASEAEERFFKVAVTVPSGYGGAVTEAFRESGAGKLGNYSGCYFSVDGSGSFIPDEGANPFIGSNGIRETVEEKRIEALVAERSLDNVLNALRRAHPYEEPAIDVFVLAGPTRTIAGTGIAGDLEGPLSAGEFIQKLKDVLDTDSVRFRGDISGMVSRVAVCGGAGGDYIGEAEKKGAQLYITGEVKHSAYLGAGIGIIEAGHYNTEKCFCRLMERSLQKALVDVKYNVIIKVSENMEPPYVDY